jgi:hypothetical protein
MDKSYYTVRQHFDLGDSGDRAVVSRIFKTDGRLYVEVQQTSDAREPTIMSAVLAALTEYERQHGIEVKDDDGSRESRREEGQEEEPEKA